MRQGNVFTRVCHSVHSGGVCPGGSGRPPGRPPWVHTPLLGRYPPLGQTPPLGRQPPGTSPGQTSPLNRRSLQRMVRILLECILVIFIFFTNTNGKDKSQKTEQLVLECVNLIRYQELQRQRVKLYKPGRFCRSLIGKNKIDNAVWFLTTHSVLLFAFLYVTFYYQVNAHWSEEVKYLIDSWIQKVEFKIAQLKIVKPSRRRTNSVSARKISDKLILFCTVFKLIDTDYLAQSGCSFILWDCFLWSSAKEEVFDKAKFNAAMSKQRRQRISWGKLEGWILHKVENKSWFP